MDQHRHEHKTEFTTPNENCQNTFPLYRTPTEEDYDQELPLLAGDIIVKVTYIQILCGTPTYLVE